MKKFFLLFVISLLCSSLAPAQEQLTVDEIIRYFPEGQYIKLQHFDIAAAERADGYSRYRQMRGGSREKIGRYYAIPEGLSKNWISYTAMILTQVANPVENEKEVTPDHATAQVDPGRDVHRTIDNGHRLAVLRFPVDFPLKEKVGNIIDLENTDEKVDGQNILTYQSSPVGGNFNSSFYAYVVSPNELLICNDIKILKMMISTGKGEIMPVDLDSFFNDAIDLIPQLGPHWTMENPHHQFIKILADVEKNETDNEKAEKFRETLSGINPFCTDYVLTDPLQTRRMTVFPSITAAKEHLAKQQSSLNKLASGEDYQKVIAKSTKLSTEGNILITSYVWTDEYVKALNKQSEVGKKLFEEQIRQRSKQKKETGEDQ